MFRANLLKYLISSHCQYDTILQNYRKINNLHLNQRMSSVKLAQTKISSITSKITPDENVDGKLTETNNLSEKEFLVRLKNDPDKFGRPAENEILDEGDIEEEKYFTQQPSPSQKLRTKQYADIIKKLIRERKIKEAIDLVEVRMIKEDRVKPEAYIFNLLLGACGRVGYTKKAFMIYNDMKRRGLAITGGTYTALFNACSNSPWPTTDGLTRARHLFNIMIEKGFQPNDTIYNAMIKAFGRCGDLPMAFSLVDEMDSKGFQIKDDTINFLLQACITDKEAGFRHALLVWRKLIDMKIKPSIFTYNLMLRSIRDCGLGDIEVTQDVINRILSGKDNVKLEENRNKLLEDCNRRLLPSNEANNEEIEETTGESLNPLTTESQAIQMSVVNQNPEAIQESQLTTVPTSKSANIRPDLMADTPHLGSLISLSEVTKPKDRLLLVGGCTGFLRNMSQHGCTPDIKTFTQLLDSIPDTIAAEKELIVAMRKANIKPDIDFYNMLIRKRSLRFDYESAKEVLVSMQRQKFRPNLMTYGILALGCRTKEEALELINEMKEKSYTLNIEILGAMLRQACYCTNISYVLEIMETCLRENVQPSKKFMEMLAEFKKKCKDLSNTDKLSRPQQKAFSIFRMRYKTWLEEVHVDETEDAHPWQQYRQTTEGGAKYKWKDANTRFKQRHISLFRVKTSTKHKKK